MCKREAQFLILFHDDSVMMLVFSLSLFWVVEEFCDPSSAAAVRGAKLSFGLD